jgi:hypothetical protein
MPIVVARSKHHCERSWASKAAASDSSYSVWPRLFTAIRLTEWAWYGVPPLGIPSLAARSPREPTFGSGESARRQRASECNRARPLRKRAALRRRKLLRK